MRKSLTTIGIICTVLAFSGCASIVSKSTYPVQMTSNPSGATFVVRDSAGKTLHQGVTPQLVTLRASQGYFSPASYRIDFTQGGKTMTVPLVASLDGWYAGNIAIGGLVGILIIDPATGAMWRLDRTVVADFSGVQAQSDASDDLRLMTYDQVPQRLRGELIALN